MQHLTRRTFLQTSGLALTAASICPTVSAAKADPAQPNILMIAVDDLRPQIHAWEKKFMKTPNIDALCKRGVRFERAYCQIAVCGASRASLLTGLRPTRKRFLSYLSRADKDAKGIPMIPATLKAAGYTCVANGKISHHLDDNEAQWSQPPWRSTGPNWVTKENLDIMAEGRKNGVNPKKNRGRAYECADVPDSAYRDGKTLARSIDDLRKLAKADKPFFFATGFVKPHLPFNAPKKYWDMYTEAGIVKLPDNYYKPKNTPARYTRYGWHEMRSYAEIPKRGPVDRKTALKLIHGYYACVSYTDALIGKLLAELKTLGLDDNTIVLLWGDHGWKLGEHAMWCKHTNYEIDCHVPLVIAAPGKDFPKGTSCPSLVEFVDIYPTLCDLTGTKKPKHLQGDSLVGLLKKPATADFKKAAFSRWPGLGESVKTDRYRYTEYRGKSGESIIDMVLFDHKTDLAENQNVANKPEYADALKEMQAILKAGYQAVRPKK
ncbi:MAG: sulfatase [Phycisphaerales bacterium]|nr:sulfatase [Phycisphaerales bacterium]MBT7171073.1 sulfatase [Phycisphaerales bacterium]